MKTERKKYESPSMQVVTLRARRRLLLDTSPEGVRATKDNYGEAQVDTWP
jgi:hypothetical protein